MARPAGLVPARARRRMATRSRTFSRIRSRVAAMAPRGRQHVEQRFRLPRPHPAARRRSTPSWWSGRGMIYYGLLLFFVLEYVRPTSYVPASLVLHLNSLVPLLSVRRSRCSSPRPATSSRILADKNTKMILAAVRLVVGIGFHRGRHASTPRCAVRSVLGLRHGRTGSLPSESTTDQQVKGVFKTLIVVHLFVAALNPGIFTDPATRHYVAIRLLPRRRQRFRPVAQCRRSRSVCSCCSMRRRSRRSVLWGVALARSSSPAWSRRSRAAARSALAAMGVYYWIEEHEESPRRRSSAWSCGRHDPVAWRRRAYFERMEHDHRHAGRVRAGAHHGVESGVSGWRSTTRCSASAPATSASRSATEYRPRDTSAAA